MLARVAVFCALNFFAFPLSRCPVRAQHYQSVAVGRAGASRRWSGNYSRLEFRYSAGDCNLRGDQCDTDLVEQSEHRGNLAGHLAGGIPQRRRYSERSIE